MRNPAITLATGSLGTGTALIVPMAPNQRLKLVLEATICVAAILLLAILAPKLLNAWMSLVAAGLFIWMGTLLFRMVPRAAVLILPNLISAASTVLALIMIEFGNPIPELALFGAPNGATATYVAYATLFYWSTGAIFAFFFRTGGPNAKWWASFWDHHAKPIAIGVIAIGVLAALYLIFKGAQSGFPLLTGADRYMYRRLSGDKLMIYMLNLKPMLSIVLGMATFVLPVNRLLKLSSGLVFALLTFTYFLFGDKFFTQIASVASFAAPYLFNNIDLVRKRVVLLALAGSIALIPIWSVTWFIYSDGGRASQAATMQKLAGRLVGQGELWYVQNAVGAPVLKWDEDFIDKNLRALKVKNIDIFALREGIGPAYFSNRYAPNNLRSSLQRNAGSVTYTAALEPQGLANFGWLGLAAMMVFVGGVLACAVLYLASAIVRRSMLSVVFATYILVAVRSFIAQGAIWQIFGIYSLKWTLVIAAVELVLFVIGRAMALRHHRTPFGHMRPST